MTALLSTGRSRRLVLAAVALLALGTLAAWAWTGRAPDLPTAEVQQTEFVDEIKLRGDLAAQKSIVLTAPAGAGDLQVLQLVKNGTKVKAGDVVVQFDTTVLNVNLEKKRSELKTAEAEIDKAQAQARMRLEEVTTELTSAGYDVQRARLEAGKQEILSEIESGKAQLKLADAERGLVEKQERRPPPRPAAAQTCKACNKSGRRPCSKYNRPSGRSLP